MNASAVANLLNNVPNLSKSSLEELTRWSDEMQVALGSEDCRFCFIDRAAACRIINTLCQVALRSITK